MSRPPRDPFAIRIIRQLLRLRAAGALRLAETRPGSGVWRYGFRAAGQLVTIDLDTTVLSLRCYHARDEVAMSPLTEAMLDTLLGRRDPVPGDAGASGTEAEIVGELRRVVADWREGNPRVYLSPPVTAGHPDNWNGA